METSVVTSKGQIVVPAKIRKKLGLNKGTRIAFIEQDGKLYLQTLDSAFFDSMAGVLATNGRLLNSLLEDKKKERER